MLKRHFSTQSQIVIKKFMLILSENIDFSTRFIHLSTVINRFIHKIFHSYPQIRLVINNIMNISVILTTYQLNYSQTYFDKVSNFIHSPRTMSQSKEKKRTFIRHVYLTSTQPFLIASTTA